MRLKTLSPRLQTFDTRTAKPLACTLDAEHRGRDRPAGCTADKREFAGAACS